MKSCLRDYSTIHQAVITLFEIFIRYVYLGVTFLVSLIVVSFSYSNLTNDVNIIPEICFLLIELIIILFVLMFILCSSLAHFIKKSYILLANRDAKFNYNKINYSVYYIGEIGDWIINLSIILLILLITILMHHKVVYPF